MNEHRKTIVLRCDHCNKPFDKESTLKRHGYYCRSKKNGTKARSRSCLSCSKAKARCDNKQPQCSRCIGRAIECEYPAKMSSNRARQNDQLDHRRISKLSSIDTPLVQVDSSSRDIDDSMFDTALVERLDPHVASLGWLDWSNIDFTDILDLEPNDEPVPFSPSESSFAPYLTIPTEQALNLSIPKSPSSNARSIVQRSKMKGGLQRIADLILHILKSYPLMMLRHQSLPPFVHSSLINSNDSNNEMEPLTNCISLVNMISNDSHGNRQLFWNNVRWECERLRREHQRPSKWELLTAMQALSIYVLIRMDEGETEHNNFDSLLTSTVTAIAQKLAKVDITSNSVPKIWDSSLSLIWKDWVFEESRRRLCVVYQVVNMLVYFEPAALCEHPTDLILAPLPAKKHLWEAADELAWKSRFDRDPAVQTAFGLAANGDLVRVGDDLMYCGYTTQINTSSIEPTPLRIVAGWEEWCSGMDGFGGLVMLAASLIGN